MLRWNSSYFWSYRQKWSTLSLTHLTRRASSGEIIPVGAPEGGSARFELFLFSELRANGCKFDRSLGSPFWPYDDFCIWKFVPQKTNSIVVKVKLSEHFDWSGVRITSAIKFRKPEIYPNLYNSPIPISLILERFSRWILTVRPN